MPLWGGILGFCSLSDQNTWDNEAPTIAQVYQLYMNDEEIKKGDSLSAALDKLHMFEIFESNPQCLDLTLKQLEMFEVK